MSKKDREGNRAERAAAIQRAQASQERNRKILVVAVVLVVLAAAVIAGVLLSGGDKKDPATTAGPSATVSGQALTVGDDPSATTKIVVYEDFLCPYCRQFEAASRTYLRKAAEQGKVLVEYRPFHLLQDEYSTTALTAWAAVLEGGTPGQALKYHDLLFENQPYENDAAKPGVADLTDLAKKAGVTDKSVLDSIGVANTQFVDAADQSATDAGVKGTPTVIVDGKTLEASSISDMSDQLEQLIAKG